MTIPSGAMNGLVPRAAAGVEMEVVDSEVLLYLSNEARAIYLNATAGLIWGLCDGKRSVEEIIRIIGDSYPDDGPRLADDVLATLTQLKESGVLVLG